MFDLKKLKDRELKVGTLPASTSQPVQIKSPLKAPTIGNVKLAQSSPLKPATQAPRVSTALTKASPLKRQPAPVQQATPVQRKTNPTNIFSSMVNNQPVKSPLASPSFDLTPAIKTERVKPTGINYNDPFQFAGEVVKGAVDIPVKAVTGLTTMANYAFTEDALKKRMETDRADFKAGKISPQEYANRTKKTSDYLNKTVNTLEDSDQSVRDVSSVFRNAAQGATTNIPKTVGSVIEGVGNIGQGLLPEGKAEDFFKGTSSFGQGIQNATDDFATGVFQTDKDNQTVKNLSQSGGELLADVATGKAIFTLAGKTQKAMKVMKAVSNTTAGKYALRTLNETFNKAKQAGKSDEQAIVTAGVNASIQFAIERLGGLDKYFGNGATSRFKSTIVNGIGEGLEEGSQQLSDNIIGLTIDPPETIEEMVSRIGEGVPEASASGWLLGSAIEGLNVDIDSKQQAIKANPESGSIAVDPTYVDAEIGALLKTRKQLNQKYDSLKGSGLSDNSPQIKKNNEMVKSINAQISKIKQRGSIEAGMFDPTGKLGKDVDPLIEEAKRYKSADEFVKSQGKPVYHGSARTFKNFDVEKLGEATDSRSAKEGFFFTDDLGTAKSYPTAENWRKVQKFIDSGDIESATKLENLIFAKQDPSNVIEAYVKFKKPLVIDANGEKYNDFSDEIETAIKKAKDNGNDGLIIKKLSDNADYSEYTPATHYLVLDNKLIKTESQLKDIYNQANKPRKDAGFAKIPMSDRLADFSSRNVDKAPQVTKTPKVTKELSNTIDSVIYDNNPELLDTEQSGTILSEGGMTDIPRIHVEDLKRYFGNTESIPAKYKRTTGRQDIDTLAANAGFDDIDTYVETIQGELDNRRTIRDNKKKLAELRRSPEVIAEAQKSLDSEKSDYAPVDNEYIPTKAEQAEYDKIMRGESKLSKIKQKALVSKIEGKRGFTESATRSKNVSDEAKNIIEEKDNFYEIRKNKELNETVDKKYEALDNKKDAFKLAITGSSDESTVMAIKVAKEARLSGDYELEANVLSEKAKRLTEAGREIQAARLLGEISPEGAVFSAAKKINEYNEKQESRNKKTIPTLTGKQAKMFGEKATEISNMKDGREKNIAKGKFAKELANLVPSTMGEKYITIWKAGLLTSPRTSMRNIIGNTLHGVAEVAKDVPASMNDALLSKKTGKREVVFTGNAKDGYKKGLQSLSDQFKYGHDPENSIEKLGIHHITWGNNIVEKGLKIYTEAVFRNLGAQDKIFYKTAESRSLYGQALAQAINDGKKGDTEYVNNLYKNPTERMKINAVKDAQTATFQNSTVGGSLIAMAKSELKKRTDLGGVIVETLMPFTGVPSSIAGQMVAYSPIGLAKGIAKDYKIFKGKVNKKNLPDFQRQASQEVGRGVIGSGLIGLGVYLTKMGLMTGQPEDAEEYRQWQIEGKQPNSIMVDGEWRSINSVGPETLILLAGSKMAEGKNPAITAANIGADFLDQTFLRGITEPIGALENPEYKGTRYVANQLSSGIPNFIKDISKANDPFKRETIDKDDFVGSVINTAKSGIPGLRNELLPQRDVLGNKVKQNPTGAAAFFDLFSSTKPIENSTVDELKRLREEGFNATPSKQSDKITVLGEKMNLTPEQLDTLKERSGYAIQSQMDQTINSDEYKNASDEMKEKVLDKITSESKASAKMELATGQSGLIDTDKLTSDNKITLNKDTFEKSGKAYEEKDGYVYKRSDEGNITVQKKIDYTNDLNNAKMTQYKDQGNLDGWMKSAEAQVKNIQEQMQDDSIDPLESIKLENQLYDLFEKMNKYTGYGGFTKPKSSSSKSSGFSGEDYADMFASIMGTTSDSQQALRQLLKQIKISRKKI